MARLREKRRTRAVRRKRLRNRSAGKPVFDGGSILEYFARRAKLAAHDEFQPLREVVYPSTFSFIEDPDRALDTLGRLAQNALARRSNQIHIQQAHCTTIGLCAESVATVLAQDAMKVGIRMTSELPGDSTARQIVAATGMPKRLRMAELPEEPDVYSLELTHGRRGRAPGESSSRDIMAQTLTDYLGDCLLHYDKMLSPQGKRLVSGLCGEVIDNAETHSGRVDWWIAAYLRRLPEGKYSEFQLTIFNLGRTLFESLSTLPRSSMLRGSIENLVQHHRQGGWLGRWGWDQELLWSLYALQEGVSRKNTAEDRVGDQGRGTADMIDFFQHLASPPSEAPTPARMCVVSGRAYFLFDTQHRLRHAVTDSGESRRLIAFNAANDLKLPPDRGNVRRLRNFFPGTLISMRLHLDKEHLDAITSKRSQAGANRA